MTCPGGSRPWLQLRKVSLGCDDHVHVSVQWLASPLVNVRHVTPVGRDFRASRGFSSHGRLECLVVSRKDRPSPCATDDDAGTWRSGCHLLRGSRFGATLMFDRRRGEDSTPTRRRRVQVPKSGAVGWWHDRCFVPGMTRFVLRVTLPLLLVAAAVAPARADEEPRRSRRWCGRSPIRSRAGTAGRRCSPTPPGSAPSSAAWGCSPTPMGSSPASPRSSWPAPRFTWRTGTRVAARSAWP